MIFFFNPYSIKYHILVIYNYSFLNCFGPCYLKLFNHVTFRSFKIFYKTKTDDEKRLKNINNFSFVVVLKYVNVIMLGNFR